MDRQTLKAKIEDKFGNMSNFSRISKTPYRALRCFLNEPPANEGEVLNSSREAKLAMYNALCDTTDNTENIGKQISDKERLQLYIDVVEISGSVHKFCDQFTQWPYDFVNNVVSNNTSGGSQRIKRKTKRVSLFIEFINSKR